MGLIGRELQRAKTLADIRSAFKAVIGFNCSHLDVFRHEPTRRATPAALRKVRKDLAELQNTLQQAKQLLSDMQVMVRANDYKIDDTVENLRLATDNLDQLTDSLKQRPWSLIRIKQPKERQVPQ